jgi:regulator of sigma E protease
VSHILALPVWGMVFWGVITFSILVFLHEGGHFLAARLFGVNVHEFMLGLPGPALRVHTKSGTAFGVTAIPLGGYVRIAGMEPGGEDPLLAAALKVSAEADRIDARALAQALDVPVEKASALLVTLADYMALDPADDDDVSYVSRVTAGSDESADALLARVRRHTYRGLRTWQRMLVLAAGVAVNIVAAILTFIVVLSIWGNPTPSLTLQTVLPKTAAQAVGLKPGDTVVAVDGARLKGWDQLLARLRKARPGDQVTITYVRGGQARTANAVLGKQDGRAFLGVGPQIEYHGLPLLTAVTDSFKLTGAVFAALGQFLGGIIHPRQFVASLKDARSVVGIAELAAQQAQAGPLDYSWFIAFLSLSLGAMNILPIPPLDGGKVLVEGIERAAGHPLKREVSLAISATGTLLLFSLIGYLMYADIARIATGH